MYGGFFALERVETRQWRADANFNYCISWDCGALPWGILLAFNRCSHMPIVRILSVIFIVILARRAAHYRSVYVFGHAAVVYGRRHQYRQIDPRAGWRDPVSVSICCGSRARWITGAAWKGQYEAAESLALGYWKNQGLVILPQALKPGNPGW